MRFLAINGSPHGIASRRRAPAARDLISGVATRFNPKAAGDFETEGALPSA